MRTTEKNERSYWQEREEGGVRRFWCSTGEGEGGLNLWPVRKRMAWGEEAGGSRAGEHKLEREEGGARLRMSGRAGGVRR